MISLNATSTASPLNGNTVMPPNMLGFGTVPSGSLNLDEKKIQKKIAEEKRKKKIYTSIFLSFSVIALIFYSVYFFYPNLISYLKAPTELGRIEEQILKTEASITSLQEEKGLYQAAYDEETQNEKAIVDVVFPTYDKLAIVREIENAINTLNLLGHFEMNAITLNPPEPQALAWVTYVTGNFTANEAAFNAFIDDYVGNSGNLKDPNSSIMKELVQLSIKPTEIQSIVSGSTQTVTEPASSVNFRLAFYTRPESK